MKTINIINMKDDNCMCMCMRRMLFPQVDHMAGCLAHLSCTHER